MQVECKQCKTTFEKYLSQIKKTKNNFCSKSCAAIFNNHSTPKRKPTHYCKFCNTLINSSKKFCSLECKIQFNNSKPKRSPKEKQEINKQAVISYRQKQKIRAIEYKGNQCEKCGYNKSVWALAFHHKNPLFKGFNISRVTLKWEKLQPELDKCELLCLNCHAEIHAELVKNE